MSQIVIISKDDNLKKRIQKIILDKYFVEESVFSFLNVYNHEQTKMFLQRKERIFYFIDCNHELSKSITMCKEIRKQDPDNLIVLLVLSTSQANFIMTSKISYTHCLLKNNRLKENIIETLTFSFRKENSVQIVGGEVPIYSQKETPTVFEIDSKYALFRNPQKDISLVIDKHKLLQKPEGYLLDIVMQNSSSKQMQVILYPNHAITKITIDYQSSLTNPAVETGDNS